MKKFCIYVDDMRTSNYKDIFTTITCRDYASTIQTIDELKAMGADFLIDLDHDLGEEKTGYDVCKYIVENEIEIIAFAIHSMNCVGTNNMRQLLTHYGYKETDIV